MSNISLAALSLGTFFGLAAGQHWDAGMGLCVLLALVGYVRALWCQHQRDVLADENKELWDALTPTIPRRRDVDWGSGRDHVQHIPLPTFEDFTGAKTVKERL